MGSFLVPSDKPQAKAFEHELHTHTLPDGRTVRFTLCPATHIYRIQLPDCTALTVPSVTGIIRGANLDADYSAVPHAVLERKRQIGAAVHKAAHYQAEGDLDFGSLDRDVVPFFDGYQQFLADTGFQVLAAERRVVGCWNGLWWAGTLDVEGLWDGCYWIIDLKCTYQLYPGHEIQTMGYELCLPKPLAPPFKYKRGSLHLKPDGKYVRPKAHTQGNDRDVFLLGLQLEWSKRHRGIAA